MHIILRLDITSNANAILGSLFSIQTLPRYPTGRFSAVATGLERGPCEIRRLAVFSFLVIFDFDEMSKEVEITSHSSNIYVIAMLRCR